MNEENKPRKIVIELSPLECDSLLYDLKNLMRVCNRDNSNTRLLFNKIASVFFEEPVCWPEDKKSEPNHEKKEDKPKKWFQFWK